MIQETVTYSVELKIYYGDYDTTGITESTLRIYELNGDEWEKVQGKQAVNEVGKYVTAELLHFSVYCVMGYDSDELKILDMVNYPNPMNTKTVFTFELTMVADVKLKIYTVSGRLVMSYEVLDMNAGYCEIPVGGTWDGTDVNNEQLANGTYIYKITAETESKGPVSAIGKLIIMK